MSDLPVVASREFDIVTAVTQDSIHSASFVLWQTARKSVGSAWTTGIPRRTVPPSAIPTSRTTRSLTSNRGERGLVLGELQRAEGPIAYFTVQR